jgi:outer membrane cobalamin receptor
MPLAILSSTKIEKIPAITMSDAISQEAGVSLVRDGIWATSVNIRGLGENRIITLIDGNRVETSTDYSGWFKHGRPERC